MRARQGLGSLRRAGQYLHGKGKAKMYKAFVRPRLENNFHAWVGTAQSNFERLDRVQDAASLIIGEEVLLWTLLNTDAELVH